MVLMTLGIRVHWIGSVLHNLGPSIPSFRLWQTLSGLGLGLMQWCWLILFRWALEPWVSPCVVLAVSVRTYWARMGFRGPARPVIVPTQDRAELLLRPTGSAQAGVQIHNGLCRGCSIGQVPERVFEQLLSLERGCSWPGAFPSISDKERKSVLHWSAVLAPSPVDQF